MTLAAIESELWSVGWLASAPNVKEHDQRNGVRVVVISADKTMKGHEQ